jgi:hypothetical protein
MDFKSKKVAYQSMQGKQYFNADQALLKKVKPDEPFAHKQPLSPGAEEKLQREILWILLDFVTVDQIQENRGISAKPEPDKGDENPAERATKIEALRTVDFDNKKTDNNLVNDLFGYFKLSATGKKKTDKMVALKAFLDTLPKPVEGTEGETTGPVTGGEQIQPESGNIPPAINAQTDELQGKVEELEDENQELQEKVEALEDEIEEQKKS